MTETDLAEVWARSLDELAGMQIEPAHRAWLQLTRPLGLVENTALIATPNEFVKEQLETRLRALITNTLSRELARCRRSSTTAPLKRPRSATRPAEATWVMHVPATSSGPPEAASSARSAACPRPGRTSRTWAANGRPRRASRRPRRRGPRRPG